MVYRIKNDKKFKNMLPEKYLCIYEIGLSSGLRVSDIIKLKKETVLKTNRPVITAQKTGKKKRIYINKKTLALIEKIISQDFSGSEFLFPSPKDPRLHISRQAVYKAFTRVAKIVGISHKVGTHCMRKKYAQKQFKKAHGDIFALQKAMQHDKTGDTAMYLVGAKDDN